MLKTFRVITLCGALLTPLAACGTNPDGTPKTFAQWSQGFQANLVIFQQDMAAVDQSVQQINATLYRQCNTMVTVTGAINSLASQCSKASPYTSIANSYIGAWCQSQAIAQNGGVVPALQAMTAGVQAAKSQLAANKKACGSNQ